MAKRNGTSHSGESGHRCLSAKALEKSLPERTRRAFVELVKDHPEEVALRGSSGDAAAGLTEA